MSTPNGRSGHWGWDNTRFAGQGRQQHAACTRCHNLVQSILELVQAFSESGGLLLARVDPASWTGADMVAFSAAVMAYPP